VIFIENGKEACKVEVKKMSRFGAALSDIFIERPASRSVET
jgi:hypothetical protein